MIWYFPMNAIQMGDLMMSSRDLDLSITLWMRYPDVPIWGSQNRENTLFCMFPILTHEGRISGILGIPSIGESRPLGYVKYRKYVFYESTKTAFSVYSASGVVPNRVIQITMSRHDVPKSCFQSTSWVPLHDMLRGGPQGNSIFAYVRILYMVHGCIRIVYAYAY